MLFNSPVFLFGFLPITLVGFFLIGRCGHQTWAVLWLVAASLFFYGWWNPPFLLLIGTSTVFNYLVGRRLSARPSKALMFVGIAGNLLALGWFKYAGFLAETINDLSTAGLPIPHVILPLGISFYTFQQIAFLVDANAGEARESSFARYALFVTFFPQLIAGPIVHHREMLSQFHDPATYRFRPNNIFLGLTAFSIGLFKKVFIADAMAPHTLLAFEPAASGIAPPFADAWIGAVAYAFQMYFDFSGYSDMAIGLGLMFGLRLPVNFASPYKAASIIEFWSRWHMTLTRFLTSYVYNPIAVSIARQRVAMGKAPLKMSTPKPVPFLFQLAYPTLMTMALAGIWHGAGWQFLAFGVFHGILLVINHAWRSLRHVAGFSRTFGMGGHVTGVVTTFVCATVGLVFFKSMSLAQAFLVLKGMVGFGDTIHVVAELGAKDPSTIGALETLLVRLASPQGLFIVSAFAIVWVLPNTPQYVEYLANSLDRYKERAKEVIKWPLLHWQWRGAPGCGGFIQGSCIGIMLALALLRTISNAPTEFLYFTF